MTTRLTPRGAYALAWAIIAALYLTVALMFPTEVQTIALAFLTMLARFGEAIALGLLVAVIAVASALVLGAALRAER